MGEFEQSLTERDQFSLGRSFKNRDRKIPFSSLHQTLPNAQQTQGQSGPKQVRRGTCLTQGFSVFTEITAQAITQVLTPTSTKHQLQNLSQKLTSKTRPNLIFIHRPKFISKIFTKLLPQNFDKTPVTRFRPSRTEYPQLEFLVFRDNKNFLNTR